MAPLQISSSFSQLSRPPPSHYARISMVLLLVIILPLLIFSFLSEAANEKDLDYSKSLDGTTQKADRSPNFLRNKAVDKLPLYNPTEDEVKFGDDIDTATHHGGLESYSNGVNGGTADSQNANHPVVDVITISAVDRIEHQRKQRETWASDEHFVRHVLLATEVNMDTSYFFGMNDGNDGGGKCSNLYFACAASQSNSSGSDNSGRDGHRDRFLQDVDLGYESRTENATNTAGNFGVNATNQMQPESSELQSEETAQSEEVGNQVIEAGETPDSLKSDTFSEETNHPQLESSKAKEGENDDVKGDLDVAKDDNVAVEKGNKKITEMETIAESEKKFDPELNQVKDIKDEVDSDSVANRNDAAEAPDDDNEPLNEEEAYCMQRRIGFAMGASSRRYHKLVHATNMKNERDSFESEMLHWKIFASKVLPEYLIVSFDTTFYNTELLVGCIDEEPSVYSPLVASSSYTLSGKSKGTKNEETFFYPQKHSGVVFNKSALEKWIRPIACFNNQDGSLSSTLEFKKTAIPIFHDPKLDELESEFCSFISSEGMAKNLLNTNKLDSVLLEALHLFRNLHEKTKLNVTNLTFSIGELLSIYSSQMHLLCDTLSNGEAVPTAEEMLGYLVHKFKITTSGNIRSFVSAEHETKSQIDEAPMKSSYASSCIASSSLSECDRVTHVACLGAID